MRFNVLQKTLLYCSFQNTKNTRDTQVSILDRFELMRFRLTIEDATSQKGAAPVTVILVEVWLIYYISFMQPKIRKVSIKGRILLFIRAEAFDL